MPDNLDKKQGNRENSVSLSNTDKAVLEREQPKAISAARITPDAQLDLFGIDSSGQPLVSRYPSTFNPSAVRIWSKILDSAAYLKYKAENTSSAKLWLWVVKAFLKECAATNTYAFSGRHDFEESAKAFLKDARQRLTKYFKESGLFEHLKLKSVQRSYSFTHQNFCIEVEAELRPVEDPTFEQWLTKIPSPAFSRHLDGVYRKSVHAHVDVHYRVTRGTSYIGYKIFCHTPVRLLDPSVPTKNKMENYVERKLWMPLVKEHRVEDLGNRLF